jgi:hypothetical protein
MGTVPVACSVLHDGWPDLQGRILMPSLHVVPAANYCSTPIVMGVTSSIIL